MMHAEAYLVQLCSLIEVGTERELKLNPGVETFENDKPTITRPNSVICKVKQRSHWRTHTIYFFSLKNMPMVHLLSALVLTFIFVLPKHHQLRLGCSID